MIQNHSRIKIVAWITLWIVSQALWAGGFRIEGSGADEAGSAGAMAARISGAMALFSNPANIGNLSKVKGEVVVGGHTILQRAYYSNIGQSTWGSEKTSHFDGYGAVSYSFKSFTLAVGQASTYQHKISWDNTEFPARYSGSGQEMSVTETCLGASMQVGNKWAFGLSLRNAQADFLFDQNRPKPYYGVETFPDFFYDYAHHNVADDSGFGFSLGAFYTPRFGMKFAFTYFSKVDFDFNGTHSVIQTSHLDDQRALSDFSEFSYQNAMQSAWSTPDIFTLAGSFKPTVRLRVEVDLSYENWSTNKNVNIQTEDSQGLPLSFNLGREWNSNLDFSTGAEFRQTPNLIWRAGLGYRLHIIDKEELNPGYPVYDRFSVASGVSYRFGNNILELSYVYHQYRDVKVENQEWNIDLDSPDFLSSNTQNGLFESQKHQIVLGYRRRF